MNAKEGLSATRLITRTNRKIVSCHDKFVLYVRWSMHSADLSDRDTIESLIPLLFFALGDDLITVCL